MKSQVAVLIFLSVYAVGCGPNKVVANLPSPSGQYHVEVRKCPQNGSLTWAETTQVSILKSGTSEKCQSATNALVQFYGFAPADQLEIKWMSDTELRAWHPSFNAKYGPSAATYKHDAPVKVIYSPKK
ncbi:putative lipoprotein (plasmid) [Ochrobactrum quorumnocens]|uniref:Putative lipoprotein n=1 Tax=Ochrobactrum quorumnocens TaxID=271865 RepID=A0A248UQ57_9HYPH|nr:hypothetical protein [[Ochrobactrum] quorumnocens]ASV88419.1 putative lipoprotein [[Ochrobactrum] quorumnocens]